MNRFVALFVGICCVFGSSSSWSQDGYIDATRLLANTTQGFVTIDDLPGLEEAWRRTGPGRLLETPEMQPIIESVRKSVDNWLTQHGGNFSIQLSDLREITKGQWVIAWSHSGELRHPYRICMIADTRGQESAADRVLGQVDTDLKKRDAQLKQESHAGQSISIYTLPTKPGRLDIDQVVFTHHGGRLILADRLDIIKELLAANQAGGAEDPLLNAADYLAVQKEIGSGPFHIRWFVRPLGMGRIVRDILRQGEIRRADVIGLLERQGFDVLKAAGGGIELGTAKHDAVHRMFVYAPAQKPDEPRFRLAAGTLEFPNTPIPRVPEWLRLDPATLFHMNWKMEQAFWACETLVDEIVDDKVFRSMLQDIRDDTSGPQIDIAKDVIGNFDDHMLIFTDNTQPSTLNSERLMLAIRLKDAAPVARVVQKAMESDPDAVLVEHPDSAMQSIWEVRPSAELDDEELSNIGFGENSSAPKNNANQVLLESWAITVYQDHLLFASHTQLLLDLLQQLRAGRELDTARQETVLQAIKELTGASEFSMTRVVSPEYAWRVKYDLLRDGKLRESDSVLASLLRRAAEEIEKANEKAQTDRQKIEVEGSKLPAFSFVAPYLGTIGAAVETTDTGWRLTQLILSTADQPSK